MDPSPSEGNSHTDGAVGRGRGGAASSGRRRQTPSTLDSIAATTSTMLPSSRPLGRTRPFVETRPEGVLSGSELEGDGYEVSAEEDDDGFDNIPPATEVVDNDNTTTISSKHKLPPIASDQDSLYTTNSNYSDSDATTTTTRRRNDNRKGSASTIKPAEDDGDLYGNTTTTGDDLQFTTSQESSQQTSPTVHQDAKAFKELPRKGTGNMTVETETVSAVPTVAVTPASSNPPSAISNLTNSSLKVKKSTDNVTSHAATTRSKKKKSSRQGVGSKAQIFAAKIASAVDEADSSDSDETFVYESNPADNPHSSSASHKERPSRFQHRRNLSNSSLNRPAIDSIIAGAGGGGGGGGGSSSGGGASSVRKLSVTSPKNSVSEPSSALFMHASSSLNPVSNPASASASSLASPATVPENLGGPGGPGTTAAKHQDFFILRDRANTNSSTNEPRRVASQHQSQTQPPLASQVIRPSISGGLGSRPNSPRRGASISKFDSDNLALSSTTSSASNQVNPSSRSVYGSTNNGVGAKPFLRPASSRYFDSKNHANYSRWRNYEDDEEYGEEDDEDAADGDIEDVDEYQQDYSETTPLRTAGQSIRRSRKNGGVVIYSPHNYQRGRRPNQRYYFLRLFLWSLFVVISLLCLGFVFGFLLATSKPMSHVQIHNLANILVSDEVLEFNIDVAAVNPGFLAIDLYDMNLDVFAKSQYVRDEQDGSLPADGSNTMLLGSISHFNAPLTFEGGFFHRAVQHNVGDVKLANPGKNSTIDDGDKPGGDKDNDKNKAVVVLGDGGGDDEHPGEPDPGGGDPDTGKPPKDDDDDDDDKKNLDEGQKRWIRVSGHPFDLIVRGTFEYSLVIGRGKRTVSVSKSVHVDPDTEVFN